MDLVTNFRLGSIPLPYKLLLTCFLITLGIGYLISIVNLNYQYSMLDGKPGITPEDLKRAFYGDRTNTRIAAKINGGSMEQYLPNPADKNKILNWIQDGAHEEEFEKNIKPILTRNCMRCHSPIGVMSQRPLTSYTEVMEVVQIDRGEPPALWARVAHTHIQSIAIMLFLLGGVFSLTSLSTKIKAVVVSIPFLDLLADFGSRFLAKYNADLVYVMMGTGAILGLSLAVMILVPLYELWMKKS
jgi:hypothetical protein